MSETTVTDTSMAEMKAAAAKAAAEATGATEEQSGPTKETAAPPAKPKAKVPPAKKKSTVKVPPTKETAAPPAKPKAKVPPAKKKSTVKVPPTKKAAAKAPPPAKKKTEGGDTEEKAPKLSKEEKAAQKAAAKAAEDAAKQKYSDDDVKAKVEKINDLLIEQESSETKNDWKIGKLLVDIRLNVNDGTWTQTCTNMIHGIAGRKLSKSSVDKKMKLYNMFQKDEKRAVAIGVGRIDAICRLSNMEDRAEILKPIDENDPEKSGGIVHAATGKLTAVEDMTVAELKEAIDKHLSQQGSAKVKSPQEKFTAGFVSRAKKLQTFIEEHTALIDDETFQTEQAKTMQQAKRDLNAALKKVGEIKTA